MGDKLYVQLHLRASPQSLSWWQSTLAHLKHSGHLIPSLHARATAIEVASLMMLAVIEVFIEHQGWLVPLISARRHRSRVFDSRSLTWMS